MTNANLKKFVYHTLTASSNGQILKIGVCSESLTFKLANYWLVICHSRAFDFRFTHSMTGIKLKKLEFQQLSQKLMKKYGNGRLQTAPQGRRMVGM